MENFLNLNNLLANNYWTILIVLSLIFIFLLIWLFFRPKENKSSDISEGDINVEWPNEELNVEEKKSKSWSTVILGVFLGITAICIMAAAFFILINNKNGDFNLAGEDDVNSSGQVHYLGILPLENPSTMLERFAGVEKYLRDKTGLNIKLRLYPTGGEVGGYTAVVRDIASGNISFAYLASVTTVQANGNGPVIPFACAQKSGSPTYRGDLVVKFDSPYWSLSDLRGKKVSGTSKSSTSGNLMPSAMLKQRNINEATYFDGGMMYLGSHDKAAEAVLAEIIDGCFINEATVNKYNANGNVLRSIWRHDPVPEFPFVVNTEKITPAELEKVKNALLSMHEENIEGIQSVDSKYEKWVAINWEDYLEIKEAIDEVYGPVFYNLDEWGED